MKYRASHVISVGVVLMAALSACGARTPAPAAAPKVYFVEPANGAAVSSPVKVKMAAENFKIEPSGDIHEGAGHLHIMVDADCVASGQVIPKDDTHVHYGKGQLEAELALTPGEHKLCLQVGNGAHQAMPDAGLSQVITITVK